MGQYQQQSGQQPIRNEAADLESLIQKTNPNEEDQDEQNRSAQFFNGADCIIIVD